VDTDPTDRVNLLASGAVRPDQVVLSAPGPVADGRPALVTWVDDGLDEMVLRVDAEGTGYLVLADAIQHGWQVTVDGVAAPLVAADHAFVAVALGKGAHIVRFVYPPPWQGTGAGITFATVIVLLLGLAIEYRRPLLSALLPAPSPRSRTYASSLISNHSHKS
jgi:hypothetical protein